MIRSLRSYFGCLLGLSLGVTFCVAMQQPAPAPTALTTLSLIVTDQADHAIDEVQKEDIQIVDEGVPQTILAITKDERPVYYSLVIDASGSFARVFEPAIRSARLIIDSNRAGDETFVETFISSDKIETVQEFTADRALLTKALDSMYVRGGQSAVIDAIYLAVQHTAEHRSSDSHRRALVVFSDCEDRASYYSEDQLMKLIRQNRVQVFVVGFISVLDDQRGLMRPSQRDKAERLASRLAAETGGRAFYPKDGKELLKATDEIMHDLHSQFAISYERQGKPSDKKFRKVKATTSGSAKIKAIVPLGYPLSRAPEQGNKRP